MPSPPPDPYTTLGVTRVATTAEITHAFRTLLRVHHPDTRPHDPRQAGDPDAELRRILTAYAILRDPGRRAFYDRYHPTPKRGAGTARTMRRPEPPPIQAGPVHWTPR